MKPRLLIYLFWFALEALLSCFAQSPPLPPGTTTVLQSPRAAETTTAKMVKAVAFPKPSGDILLDTMRSREANGRVWTVVKLTFKTNLTGFVDCSQRIEPWLTLATWRITNKTSVWLCGLGLDGKPHAKLFYRVRLP